MEKIHEKHKVLNDSATFLINVVEDPIATEIKDNMLMMNRRWNDVIVQVDNIVKRQSAEKSQQEYAGGLHALKDWTQNTDTVVNSECNCTAKELQEYHNTLQV